MKKLVPLLFLGIAFGIIEGSVVVYLRPCMNRDLSDFSMNIIRPEALDVNQRLLLVTEVCREAATLALLASAAALAATALLQWFCYFVFAFGVWDIIYYCWIYIRIGWPSSLLDWDVLFLIPRMWLAPVIVPCIISLAGIAISMLVLRAIDCRGPIRPRGRHWIPVGAALALWQISFLDRSAEGMTAFPDSYSWWLFFTGMFLAVLGASLFYYDFFITGKTGSQATGDRSYQ